MLAATCDREPQRFVPSLDKLHKHSKAKKNKITKAKKTKNSSTVVLGSNSRN